MNDDDDDTSNATIAGSAAAVGVAGMTEKSLCTLTFCDAIAYIASDGKNQPASSVDDGARVRRDAPSTVTNSYKLPPLTMSPSTS